MADGFGKLAETLRAQATPRSLIGLGLLGVMLAVVGIGSLMDAVATKQQRVRDLTRSVAVQRSLADGQEWLNTVGTLRDRRAAIEGRFWQGATPGIVAARLQNDIEGAAERAGLDRIRIEIQPLPEDLAGSGRVRFEVTMSARDRHGQFLSFFQHLHDLDATIVPSDFEWRRTNASVRTTLLAPAIVGSGETAGGDAS